MDEEVTKAPKANKWDAAYHALKIMLGMAGQLAGVITGVPVSVPASEFMSALFDEPVKKRRDRWVELMALRIVELEARLKELKIEDLPNNEKFVSALLHASNIAARTHQKEKLEALANAVMRTATPSSVDDDVQIMFLQLVDRLTPYHLILLDYFNDRFGWSEKRNSPGLFMEGGWITNFDEAFPDFKGRRDAFYWTIQDLINLGLLREKPDDSYRIDRMLPPAFGAKSSTEKREESAAYREHLKERNLIDIFEIKVTGPGKAFLEFISARPFENNTSGDA